MPYTQVYGTFSLIYYADFQRLFESIFILLPKHLHHVPARVHEDVHVAAPQAGAHPVGHDAAQAVEALAHVHRLVVQPVLDVAVQTKHCSQILSPAGAPRSCSPGCASRNRRMCGSPPSGSFPGPVASVVCLWTSGLARTGLEPLRASSGRTLQGPATARPLHDICASTCSTDAWLFRGCPDSPAGLSAAPRIPCRSQRFPLVSS